MPRPLLLVVALFAAGCGSDTVRVSGRLVNNGRPYAASQAGDQPDTLSIDLTGNGFVFPATVGPDGRFTIPGSAGAGVPRGSYKLTVLHTGFMGAGGDRLKGRYTADTTPLTLDLTKSAELVVDVGAGTVQAN